MLPVLNGAGELTPARRSRTALPGPPRAAALPAVQAAAAAATGFVAGAAVVGLAHRRHKRAAALTKGRRARRHRSAGGVAGELIQVVGSRSLLLDVHLLGRPGER